MKKFFRQLSDWNWQPSWTFIHIGANFIDYDFRIKINDIQEYATLCLERELTNEACLSILIADSDAEIYKIIADISQKEQYSNAFAYEVEKRKWITYALYQAIFSLNDTPSFNDLLLLNDLWYYFDFPTHYPWNPKTNEYIKVVDLKEMIDEHKKWLNKEIAELRYI